MLTLVSVTLGVIAALTVAVSSEPYCTDHFRFMRHVYRSVAMTFNMTNSNNKPIARGVNKVTGQDIVVALGKVCSAIPVAQGHWSLMIRGCTTEQKAAFQEAVGRSLWMCDSGKLRNSFVTALTGNGNVPDAEKEIDHCRASLPDKDRCPDIMLEDRYKKIRDNVKAGYGPVLTVINQPEAIDYFHKLFACYNDAIKAACPNNAIPVILAVVPHFIFPPKFGINVTDIILHASH